MWPPRGTTTSRWPTPCVTTSWAAGSAPSSTTMRRTPRCCLGHPERGMGRGSARGLRDLDQVTAPSWGQGFLQQNKRTFQVPKVGGSRGGARCSECGGPTQSREKPGAGADQGLRSGGLVAKVQCPLSEWRRGCWWAGRPLWPKADQKWQNVLSNMCVPGQRVVQSWGSGIKCLLGSSVNVSNMTLLGRGRKWTGG